MITWTRDSETTHPAPLGDGEIVRAALFESLCNGLRLWFVFLVVGGCRAAFADEPVRIEVWYGHQQSFGRLGHPQRWINVLGHAGPADELESLTHRLNDSDRGALSFAEDNKRIARDGDFNVEIDRSELKHGQNRLEIVAKSRSGESTVAVVRIEYRPDHRWPLPYTIDWSEAGSIQEVAQVVDGKWKLTPAGVRSVERYYDRVIAFGDASWTDYEVTTTVTVHGLTGPREGANTTRVTHAAIALRWPGHDADGMQPSVKWHPLGATAEFRLGNDLQDCRWRIFDGKRDFYVESDRRRPLTYDKPYRMKHRVETLPDGQSRYRVKLWPADETEPSVWDLERIENGDLASGSALLIAHHSDVTFGDVSVVPID